MAAVSFQGAIPSASPWSGAASSPGGASWTRAQSTATTRSLTAWKSEQAFLHPPHVPACPHMVLVHAPHAHVSWHLSHTGVMGCNLAFCLTRRSCCMVRHERASRPAGSFSLPDAYAATLTMPCVDGNIWCCLCTVNLVVRSSGANSICSGCAGTAWSLTSTSSGSCCRSKSSCGV